MKEFLKILAKRSVVFFPTIAILLWGAHFFHLMKNGYWHITYFVAFVTAFMLAVVSEEKIEKIFPSLKRQNEESEVEGEVIIDFDDKETKEEMLQMALYKEKVLDVFTPTVKAYTKDQEKNMFPFYDRNHIIDFFDTKSLPEFLEKFGFLLKKKILFSLRDSEKWVYSISDIEDYGNFKTIPQWTHKYKEDEPIDFIIIKIPKSE